MYAEVITHFLFPLFAINSFPRHGQTVRDIKNPLAIFHPQCLDFMLTEFRGDWLNSLGVVYRIPGAYAFKQTIIADFLLGWGKK
jgi:hypothetical protein